MSDIQIDRTTQIRIGEPPPAFQPGKNLDDFAKKSKALWRAISYARTPVVIRSSAVDAPNTFANFAPLSSDALGFVPITLAVDSADGTWTALPSIPFEFVLTGKGGMAFVSSQHSNHEGISIRLDPDAGQMHLRFALNYSGLNVKQTLEYVSFCQALAQGGELRITGRHPITGGDLLIARGGLPQEAYEGPDVRFVEVLNQLVLIQSKTGVSFTIPEGDISGEEVRTIAATTHILKTGHASYKAEPWVSTSSIEQAKSAIASFERGAPLQTALHFQEQTVVIFGTQVPLGPVTFFCDRTYITEEDMETAKRNIKAANPEGKVSIRLTPFEDCPIEARYINWVPVEESVALRQLPIYKEDSPNTGDIGSASLNTQANEQQQGREQMNALTEPALTEDEREDEFEQYLAAKGVITLPDPSTEDDAEDEWEPVTVTGKPLSEMIIEERR
jgi:hypothetical protein